MLHRRIIVLLFILYSVLTVILTIATCITATIPGWVFIVMPLLSFAFGLNHAMVVLGYRNTFIFYGLCTVISFVAEAVGVSTGIIFGAYRYSNLLGPMLLGVPLIIPFSWFMLLYPSYCMANFLIDRQIVSTSTSTITKVIGLAGLAALIFTSWDLMADPLAVAYGQWTWLEGGAYFGIPIRNFIGWLGTSFTIGVAYRFFELSHPATSRSDYSPLFSWLPTGIYSVLGSSYIFIFPPLNKPVLSLIAAFTMLPLALVANFLFVENKKTGNLT